MDAGDRFVAALTALLILLAYGVVGRMDYDEELRLEAAAVASAEREGR
jgi:hypothetical protein